MQASGQMHSCKFRPEKVEIVDLPYRGHRVHLFFEVYVVVCLLLFVVFANNLKQSSMNEYDILYI